MKIKSMPEVSVIIPCRNESNYIEQCLKSILQNDFDQNNMEILVVDGMSEDGTREIVKNYTGQDSKIRLIDNPLKITPAALNIGIKNSTGKIIIRVDAHAEYPSDYVSKLVGYLEKLDADNVGGQWITLPSENTLKAKAIAAAMSSVFGIGNAWYRLQSTKIREVDTVPFGCFRRNLFDRIGFFNERLIRNQDDEFNARIKKNGGKIYLIPEIKIRYFARDKLNLLMKTFYQYGFYKPLVNIIIGHPATIRQLFPPVFVLFLLLCIPLALIFPLIKVPVLTVVLLYVALNLFFSVLISTKGKEYRITFILPVIFFLIHVSYGTGYLFGLFKFVLFKPFSKIFSYG